MLALETDYWTNGEERGQSPWKTLSGGRAWQCGVFRGLLGVCLALCLQTAL